MKKNPLVFLFVFLFAFFGGFGAWSLQSFTASATSPDASVWDGNDVSNVTADDWYNDGVYYYIRSAKGLVYFCSTLKTMPYRDNTIYLETDINLNNNSWTPINGANFAGTFDGQGHTIYNLKVETSNDDSAGFFAVLGNGTIRNLNFASANIDAKNGNAGILAGRTENQVLISNCSFQGTVNGVVAGGVVGNGNVNAQNVRSDVAVTGTNIAGGIVGQTSNSTILNTANLNSASIKSDNNSESVRVAGGIVGLVGNVAEYGGTLTLQNSFNVGDVAVNSKDNKRIGGLVGASNGSTSISHSYFHGKLIDETLNEENYCAGLVGLAQGSQLSILDSFCVDDKNAYPIANVLAGITSNEIRNTYSSTNSNSNYLVNLEDLAKTESFYSAGSGLWSSEWDFSSVWKINNDENGGLPTLRFAFSNGDTLVGDGSQNNPYQIKTAGDLAWVSTKINSIEEKDKSFILLNDIDLSGKVWQPIGSEGTPFSGVFDGNGHKIFNLKSSTHETFGSYGLFGATNNAIIKDLTVENFIFDIQNNTNLVGNIVGKAENTYIINCQDNTDDNNVTIYDQSKADANSVGSFGSGNYVIYGDYGTNTLDFDDSDGKYNTGYDIQVLGNGGVFYDQNEKMIFGEYHILVEESGENFQPIIFNENLNYYMFYHSNVGEGKLSFLPGDSSASTGEKTFSKDVLIKVGSRPIGWTYADNNETFDNDTFAVERAIFGIKRTWQDGVTKTLKVVYNQYENDHYDVQEQDQDYLEKPIVDGQPGEKISMLEKEISVSYVLPYDSKLSDDINSRIFGTPKYYADGNQERYLRNGDYEVAGIYADTSLGETQIEQAATFVNDAFFNNTLANETVYAKWDAQDEVNLSFTFNLQSDKWQGEEVGVDLKDVVRSLKLTGSQEKTIYGGSGVERSEFSETMSTNIYRASTYLGNSVGIEIQLENGYFVASVALSNHTDPDSNFGKCKIDGTKYKLENIATDHAIEILISRQVYTDTFVVSDDAYFGFGGFEAVTLSQAGEKYSSNLKFNLQLQNDKFVAATECKLDLVEIIEAYCAQSETDAQTILQGLAETDSLYVGIDPVGRILFSANSMFYVDFTNIVDGFGDILYGNGLRFSYDGQTTYSLKIASDSSIVFGKIIDDKQVQIATLKSKEGDNTTFDFQYLSWTSFRIVVSTDSQEKQFTNAGIYPNDRNYFVESSAKGTDDSIKIKYGFNFENVRKLTNNKVEFRAITAYSTAYVQFDVKFNGENVPENFQQFKPETPEPQAFDVSTSKTISFAVNPTEFYKWAGTNSQDLWNFVKVSVAHANTEIENYETNFNGENANLNYKNYFSSPTFNFNSNEFLFTFYGSNEAGTAFGLQPGLYTFTILCDYVDYSLSIQAGEVPFSNYDSADLLNNVKDLNLGKNDNQGNFIEITNVTLVADEQRDVLENLRGLGTHNVTLGGVHFDDSITIDFNSLRYKNLKLLGFLVNDSFVGATAPRGENLSYFDAASKTFAFNSANLSNSTIFGDLYSDGVDIKVIFVRKSADISFDTNVEVDNVQDDSTSVVQSRSLGISFRFEHESGNENYKNDSIYFDYNQSANISTKIKLIDGVGFSFAGFKILKSQQEEVANFISQDGTLNYDQLETYLDSIVDNEKLFIRPVLNRKELTIKFTSGSTVTFGDEIDKVFDVSGQQTTSLEVSVKFKYGSTFNIQDLRFDKDNIGHYNASENGSFSLNDIFHSRKGYTGTDYWQNFSTRYIGQFNVGRQYFTEAAENDITLSKIWTTNFYNIVFNIENDVYQIKQIEFGKSLPVGGWPLNPTKTGFNFDGWFDDDGIMVLNADGSLQENSAFTKVGNNFLWSNESDIQLYAQFSAMNLKVRVIFNSNFGELGDSVLSDVSGNKYAIFEVVYGTQFQLSNLQMMFDGTSLVGFNPTRPGFALSGYYIFDEDNLLQIDANSIFDFTLPTFKQSFSDGDEVLTLQLVWEFENQLYYSFEDTTFEKTFNGSLQTTNVLRDFGFAANFEGEQFGQETKPSSELIAEWRNWFESLVPEGSNLAISSSSAFSMSQRDCGVYTIEFSLIVTDRDQLFAGQEILSQNFRLTFSILQASISFDLQIDKLENAKSLMKPFVNVDEASNFEQLGKLAGLSDENLQQISESYAENVEDEIYAFIMAKYYNLLFAKDAENYVLYKTWTYENFVSMPQSDKEEISRNCQPFVFFDYEKDEFLWQILQENINSSISVFSNDAAGSVFAINAIEIVSTYQEISAGQSYQLRIEMSNADIGNFTGYTTENNKYYLAAGNVFVMPQPLFVQNSSKKNTVYYSSEYSTRDVEILLGESREINGNLYFDISQEGTSKKLFAAAKLRTNNAGNAGSDTVFTFGDNENFLILTDIQILLGQGEEFVDVTENFKLILTDDFNFKILSTKNIVLLNVQAKYLTLQDGFISFDTVAEDLASGLLRVERIFYDGGSVAPENELFENGIVYAPDNTILCEILSNERNEISLYVSGSVEAIEFSVNEMEITQYAALSRWDTFADYNVDGNLASTNTFRFDLSEINKLDDDLTTQYLYATYTDLVRVNYDFGFPEGYEPQISTTNILKIGESTIDDIVMPQYLSFSCTKLSYIDANYIERDYTQLFDSGTFDGLSSNSHATVTLFVKWTLDPQLSVMQKNSNFRQAVSTLDSLTIDQIVYLTKDEAMFEYSFQWLKDGVVLSATDTLTFAEGGKKSDDGTYTLKIVATLNDEFLGLLEDSEAKTSSCSVDFSVIFELYHLISIEFEEIEDFAYDGVAHNDFRAVVTYQYFDNVEDRFVSTSDNLTFGATGLFGFEITKDGGVVAEIKDAGTYTIKLLYKQDLVTLDESFVETTLSFKILPKHIDLLAYGFSAEKEFNKPDEIYEQQISATDFDQIKIVFDRESGEDVGEYELYFGNLSEGNAKNFDFYANDVLIYSNGRFVGDGKTTKIGTFTIKPSTSLRLEVVGLSSNILTATYKKSGYTARIFVERGETDILYFEIAGTDYKFKVSLFDENTGLYVTNEQALTAILSAIEDVSLVFYTSSEIPVATARGTYSLRAKVNEFTKYYSSVTFDDNVRFEIEPIVIDVTGTFVKDYDGTDSANYAITTEDVVQIDYQNPVSESYSGLYVAAQFTNWHAGQTSVTLTLKSTSDDEAQNYQLATGRANGEIKKIAAKIRLKADGSPFEYGTLSTENLTQYITLDKSSLQTPDGQSLEDKLLIEGYYDLKLSSKAPTTSTFFNVGTVVISTEGSTFSDFDMTIDAFSVEISKLSVNLEIVNGYITITTNDIVQNHYVRTLDIPGQTITLQLVPFDADGSRLQTAKEGSFLLAFEQDGRAAFTSSGDNYEITIPEDNKGFAVVQQISIYTVLIAGDLTDDTISVEYRGQKNPYQFSVSDGVLHVGNKTFTLSVQEGSLDLSNLKIFSGIDTTSWTNASTYELAASLSGVSVKFDKAYKLEITPKDIDPDALPLQEKTKIYDGNFDYRNENFTGKIEGDNVYISGQFDQSSVDDEIGLNVSLHGADRANYHLTKDKTIGKISPLKAQISLKQTSFVYGQLSEQNGVLSGISSGAVFEVRLDNGEIVQSAQYTLSIVVSGEKHGTYFVVGSHNITVSAQSVSGNALNYEIEKLETTINISKRSISLVFANPGEIKRSYGTVKAGEEIEYQYQTDLYETITLYLRRANAQNINPGLYKILSARTDDANYQVNSVRDESEGAFEITRQESVVYVLAEDGTEVVKMEYDGKSYDRLSLSMEGDNVYLVLSSSQDRNLVKKLALKLFVLEDGKYVDFDKEKYGQLKNLSSILSVEGIIKDAKTYNINAEATTSDTHAVSVGLGTHLYALQLVVTSKNIYFAQDKIYETFKNDDAVFEYSGEQLSTMLVDQNGESVEADLTVRVTFMDQDKVAKYRGQGYTIEAEIVGGSDQNNFVLHATTNDEKALEGVINPAKVKISINSTTIEYGQNVEIAWGIVGFDVQEYLQDKPSGRLFEATPNFEILLSSSSHQKAGSYSLTSFTFRSNDFDLDDTNPYIIDGVETEDIALAKIIINPAKLQISPKGNLSLQQIFTKTYDGDSLVHDLLSKIEISGWIAGDRVALSGAEYRNRSTNTPVVIGNASVVFTLGGTSEGDDSTNYVIEPYEHGIINPIQIKLNYDFDRSKYNATVSESQWLNTVDFPFVNNQSLSGNASNVSHNIFIDNLIGTGVDFVGWSLDFATSGSDFSQEKILYLQNLVARFGLSIFEDKSANGVSYYSIKIEDNKKSVEFLSALVSEDVENVVGFYFKDNAAIQFDLKPNFDWKEFEISVKASPSNMTNVHVEVEGKEISSPYIVKFGSNVVLKAVATGHCSFENFYLNGDPLTTGNGFEVGVEADNITRFIAFTVDDGMDYNFEFRFVEQMITTKVDVSESGATLAYPQFVLQDGVYTRDFTYSEISQLYVSQLSDNLTKYGSLLSSIVFSYTLGGENSQEIYAEDFADTKLSFLIESTSQSLTLNLLPKFKKISVNVTLDYGYEKPSDQISVEYEQSYAQAMESAGLSATPQREGYDFVGWSKNGVLLSDSSQNTEIEDHSLLAVWNVSKFNITLTLENLEISEVKGISFENNGQTYSAKDVEFNTAISFVLTAFDGYEFSSEGLENYFAIKDNQDGSVLVEFNLPAKNVEATFVALAKLNDITIIGDNIAEIVVTDLTDSENIIEVTENSFKVLTDHNISVHVTAVQGFHMTETVDVGGTAILSTSIVDGTLVMNVSNIKDAFNITVQADANTNNIFIEFEDADLVESFEINGVIHNINDLTVDAMTGETLEIYVVYKFGFAFKDVSSSDFDVSHEAGEGSYEGLEKIVVSNIFADGQIFVEHQRLSFHIEVHSITYEQEGEDPTYDKAEARAYIEEEGITSETYLFEKTINLGLKYEIIYRFVGWSLDGNHIFNSNKELAYVVEGNQEIFAIFVKDENVEIEITFATVYAYQTGLEYNQLDRVVSHFDKFEDNAFLKSLSGNKYYDAESGEQISTMGLYYGTEKSIIFEVPEGFEYRGFGYFEDENEKHFTYISILPSPRERVTVNISSLNFRTSLTQKVYMVVSSKQVEIEVQSVLQLDGEREIDTSATKIELVDQEENKTNPFGYIEGTRIHYANENIDQHCNIVAYSADEVYILASVQRSGFKFVEMQLDNENGISNLEEIYADEYRGLYRLSGLVGGMELGITVISRPIINNVNLSFVLEDEQDASIEGGSFVVKVDDENKTLVKYSGFNNSSVVVSAYTDSTFVVEAYIKEGYLAKTPYYIADGDVVFGVSFENMSVSKTGFNGKVVFTVENFLSNNNIKIVLTPKKYNILFESDSQIVATLEGVEFGKTFDTSHLSLVTNREGYNFEGYFSHENGQGMRYVDSEGNPTSVWLENGYVFSGLSGEWQLSENASFVTLESGEEVMQIVLYAYHSFMKTRVSFEIVPNPDGNITAQNIVGGVTPYTSWFNRNMPMYMEIAYNTAVQFTAPQFDGYRFYKFVINQKKADGTWLDSVESLASSIPWISTEKDNIVECRIQIVYFSKVEVVVVGGDAEYQIAQEESDPQAEVLLREFYVDTTKTFSITAIPKSGYTFVRWTNVDTGYTTNQATLTVLASYRKSNLKLEVVGNEITLDFSKYNVDHGQIVYMTTRAKNGTESNAKYLGGFNSDQRFEKNTTQVVVHVGEIVKLHLLVEQGYSVAWNDEIKDYITFDSASNGFVNFNIEMSPALETYLKENQMTYLSIEPIFDNQFTSIYIQTDFAYTEKYEDSIDNNNVNFAGQVVFAGQNVKFVNILKGNTISLLVATNPRYAVARITISQYNSLSQQLSLNENNEIVLPENLEGVVNLRVEFRRLNWHDVTVERTTFDGDGVSNPYKISSVEDLILMEKLVNSGERNENGVYYRDAAFELTTDLNLSDRFWTPIGNAVNPFNGRFDFKGHSVAGIYLERFYQPIAYNGLFGVLGAGAVITIEPTSIWWLWLIIAIVVVLVIVFVALVLYARKRKKLREKLANK